MKRLIIKPQAMRDIEGITDNIALHSPAAAARVNRKIETALMRLTDFPDLGRVRGDLQRDVRSLVVSPQLIFYRVDPDSVLVLRCVDGRTDPKEWL